ncbi:MAG: ABC transporter ATP-binding protein [Bdellovibrionales bacterium]|nr:ABC transporter ATP-binding protein [Bdellovibrionales bacterium]
MAQPLMKTIHVNKTYAMGEVEVKALIDVNLELYESEFVVLLGHSGSGKSTLLNILGGLDRPTSGELYFAGERIDQYSDRELTLFRRENIGFIFQMYNLIPRLSGVENVELVTEISSNPMDPIEALSLVGLKERAGHFPSQMSGGEQQRIAIARAIAKQPRLLFCDEPTGALDVKTGIMVLEAIQKVNKTLGTTTIVITHNVAIAEMADRVITLVDGRVEHIKTNQQKISAQDLKW